jgi:redox-sensitive bicupin YhaK (pirin superfamily)
MSQIEVKKIIKAINASDGAGVKLKRSIGTPEADYIDPFLMLDEFGSENKDDYLAGFPPHPHRGIETVTYMLNGEFEHEDSTGSKGKMTPGDIQWMKTGRGIIHSEMPAMTDGKLLGFQLWINMPANMKMNKPKYDFIKAKFLLISGKPIGEPIARGGPFVMNTKAEILQAVQDYHNDTFVK